MGVRNCYLNLTSHRLADLTSDRYTRRDGSIITSPRRLVRLILIDSVPDTFSINSATELLDLHHRPSDASKKYHDQRNRDRKIEQNVAPHE